MNNSTKRPPTFLHQLCERCCYNPLPVFGSSTTHLVRSSFLRQECFFLCFVRINLRIIIKSVIRYCTGTHLVLHRLTFRMRLKKTLQNHHCLQNVPSLLSLPCFFLLSLPSLFCIPVHIDLKMSNLCLSLHKIQSAKFK